MSQIIAIPSFEANIVIRGKIELLTGMHIGGSKEKLEIGGVDNVVIRNPRNSYPYIPGSSIKGKMRHLLEYLLDAIKKPIGADPNKPDEVQKHLGKVSKDERIVRLFGIGADDKDKDETLKGIGLARLIVRDAYPDQSTINMWEEDLGSDSNFTEYKAENTIDRLTSAANPRFIERVVEGSKFEFEMVYSVYRMEDKDTNEVIEKDLIHLFAGLRLMEGSALGKAGSRGYGKIRFHVVEPSVVKKEDYLSGDGAYKNSSKPLNDHELMLLSDDRIMNFKYQ